MLETIVKYYCIDWLALVLNAIAIYLLGKKLKTGFSFGVVANMAWIVFGVLAHSMATVVACSIFVALNIKGWMTWTAATTGSDPCPKSFDAEHLYNYQMQVIREGLPPLPIPLTPEQNAQLVKEGVLPP